MSHKTIRCAIASLLVIGICATPGAALAAQVTDASAAASCLSADAARSMLQMTKSVTIDGYVTATVTYTYYDGYGKAIGIQSKSLSCKNGAAGASFQQCYIESGGKTIFMKVSYYRPDYGWKSGTGRIIV